MTPPSYGEVISNIITQADQPVAQYSLEVIPNSIAELAQCSLMKINEGRFMMKLFPTPPPSG